ncbi:multidrug transporter [Desulfuribacillus stibiiarsenatis]|uniref:Multidrug transporter n=1 Tax=Desulfuribacillus stibiiarsenatis TaxID=1390249 RepID=A0A1E5L2B9_9FIRM|nr:DMT family transporter [Desulfuribacillus stibiiarsenatis]OEH84298.1 multidrug transporter [Desulfuribacillus stibiiarsenatis]
MNKHSYGYFIAFATILIWGTTYIFTKNLLNHFTPYEIVMYRTAFAWMILIAIYPKFNFRWNWKEERLFLALGVLGVTMYYLLENIALNYTQASNVGLIVSSIPLFTAIIAHYMHKDEAFHRNQIYGFVFAIIGIFLIIFNGSFHLNLNPLGDILAFICALVWALYTNLLKRVNNQMSPVVIVRKTFFYGLVTLVPILLLQGIEVNLTDLSNVNVLGSILYLSAAASVLCFLMWNKAISMIGSVKASNFIYLIPLITMASSYIFLKETITWSMLFGGILILFGVYVNEHKRIAIQESVVETAATPMDI